jgi:multicomponent Na+:H+ antiporter subunit B
MKNTESKTLRRLDDCAEGEKIYMEEEHTGKTTVELDESDMWRKAAEGEEKNVSRRFIDWARKNAERDYRAVYPVFAVLFCVMVITVLLLTVSWLPRYGDPSNPANNEVPQRYIEQGIEETGAINFVAGMILDYRAFDTLGESNVLFIAVCSVLILLRTDRTKGKANIREMDRPAKEFIDDSILKYSAAILVPIGFIFGIYVILNGHLSAGGGFSGGAIIGASLILYVSAFGEGEAARFFTYGTYKWVSFAALLTYAGLKTYSFFTGANHLESGIPLGTPGAILSSGLILPLNICVGCVVACTMYAFYSLFRKGGI